MNHHFSTGLKLTFLTMILFGVVYPLLITAIASLSPGSGDGKVVEVNGKVVGFEVIGQSFKSDNYFNGRPSAVGYNAAATGGSNKGPANPDYLAEVEQRITEFLKKNPDIKKQNLPVELVTASGGGLDPDISVQAALVQVSRISKSRNVEEEQLVKLVNDHIEKPLFGMLGPARINVLKLNIALDGISNK